MDFIFEFIAELIFEGSLEIAGSKKVPIWIRIPLIIIFGLFFAFIFIGLFFLSIAIMRKNILGGISIMLVDVLMAAGIARYFIKFRNSIS